jgi:hypothetical protein
MDRDRLKQHLISETTRLFCVLDGASVPKLPMQLHKMQAANVCLFKGDLEPDMLYVAPFVVHLPPNDKFTDWARYWVKEESYDIGSGDRRWPVKKASCWISQQDFVHRNVL